MKKVLYIQPLHPAGMKYLSDRYEVVIADNEDQDFLRSIIGEYHAVVTRLTRIDRRLMEAGGKLQAIAKHGVGTDNIDVKSAEERGIRIVTTGDANSGSVAEHTVLALGALAKRIPYLNEAVRNGCWEARDEGGSVDICGKIVGIAGFGRIGSRVAAIMKQGFGADVFVYDPFASRKEVEKDGYHWVADMDELCRLSDFLTLHMPLTEDTRSLIDSRRLAMMKPTAYLANFARGGIVDEQALYDALSDRVIAGAAVDAFENEPPPQDCRLLQLDHVLLSPHCATFSEDSRRRMSLAVARGIDEILGDER